MARPEPTFNENRVRHMAEILFLQYGGKLGERVEHQSEEIQDLWMANATALEFLFGQNK